MTVERPIHPQEPQRQIAASMITPAANTGEKAVVNTTEMVMTIMERRAKNRALNLL